ncbi:hypothetical protein CspeluHIS016_0903140 [Cutaneotrichosporon spelunceum]|uniref:Uncharacterized protein n=1 Tax=Cutaneotrichosporon spelunceum TaxID=1672016 RepID=A0AAD3YFK6_9TREE|nr:hypothetical protein CspeluHIS016_0903140 [Cutaneotrichosporon spelunceum]
MRGLGLSGVPELEANALVDLDDTAPIDPHRPSLPRPPTPEVEMAEHPLSPPASPRLRFPPSSAVNWTPPAKVPTPHWSPSPSLPASPTALFPPPRRRPLSTHAEWMAIREPTPTRQRYSSLALPAELDLEGVQLFRRASLPLPPRSPTLSLGASRSSPADHSRSPERRTLIRRSLPECEPICTRPIDCKPYPGRVTLGSRLPETETESGKPGLASPIRLETHQRDWIAVPVSEEKASLTPAPTPTSLHDRPRAVTPPDPERRRYSCLPLPGLARLLALILVPVSMWLYWWQRQKLSGSTSGSSLSAQDRQEVQEREECSDDSDGEEEATIQAAWRESMDLSPSMRINLRTHRNSLTVPGVGGIPMSREASWDGSAYPGALHEPSPSPPFVSCTEDGLLDW